jgi:glycogen synthase
LRAIVLSWEYPPRVVGQLAEYVKTLVNGLAANKVDISVVTYDDRFTEETQEPNTVKTVRVTNPVKTHIGVLTWVLTLNQEIERAIANVYYSANRRIDLIDVFDWHFIPAAVTLKKGLGIPFVYSVESLEDHRSPTANSSYNLAIQSIEWLGFYEAQSVTVKSQWMKDEVARIYQVPLTKISVITPNPESDVNEFLNVYRSIVELKKDAT